MKKVRSHTFIGKKYKIEWLSPSKVMSGTAYAAIDNPESKNKKIQFANDIPKERELEIYLHELYHLFFWGALEKDVEQMGKDVAAFLKRLGYIKLASDEMVVKKHVN